MVCWNFLQSNRLLNALAAEREPTSGGGADRSDDEGDDGLVPGAAAADEGEDDLELMTREAGDDADAVVCIMCGYVAKLSVLTFGLGICTYLQERFIFICVSGINYFNLFKPNHG